MSVWSLSTPEEEGEEVDEEGGGGRRGFQAGVQEGEQGGEERLAHTEGGQHEGYVQQGNLSITSFIGTSSSSGARLE